MRRKGELETRLSAWACEYLAAIKSEQTNAPSVCSIAAEVEQAVRTLEIQPHGRFSALALRYEYSPGNEPVDLKMRRLRRLGLEINSAAKYSQLLREARQHVAAWLHIPFAGELDQRFMTTLGSPDGRLQEA
ncbi:hypothetical protein HDE76_003248 [Rhodanobacter sp. ANJX3]|uniref:hypothetical protein n=1 Tax=Rhodanobacter sp. ANJX3 TaxID=2723083 RepID=UPI001607F171|nr:hypothetical protein [Rhodanobacter sp. ANJX3]MBB5360006.1 hypothetical protein [Rhodanobacter sp. ANJX3]